MATPLESSQTTPATPEPGLECQLAQVQLKRYLAGQDLPEELLDDLNAHLERCGECRAAAGRVRDAITQVMARAQTAPGTAPEVSTEPDSADTGKVSILGALRSGALKVAISQPRTVGLSIALAVVLIAMSTLLRDPTKLFGPKVATAEAAKAESNIKQTSHDENQTPSSTAAASEHSGAESGHDDASAPDSHASPPSESEHEGGGHDSAAAPHSSTEHPATSEHDSSEAHAKPGVSSAKAVVGHETAPVGGRVVVAKPKSAAAPVVRRTISKPKTKTTKRRPATTRRTTTASTPKNHVRIYDEDGRPKN